MNSALLGKSSSLCVCWLSVLCHYVLSVRQLFRISVCVGDSVCVSIYASGHV